MRQIPPWLQLTLFAALCLVLGLPPWLSAYPERWVGAGIIGWACFLLIVLFWPRAMRGKGDVK